MAQLPLEPFARPAGFRQSITQQAIERRNAMVQAKSY